MWDEFDTEEAKKFLRAREENEKDENESKRLVLFDKTIAVLKTHFKESDVEVYLVGSILKPFSFSPHSDIDIVLKNFKGDRFDIWVQLEQELGRKVEIILFETCHFQEFVLKEGHKVI